MASKQVMVEVAEFLESSAAREMVAVPRDVAKRIAEPGDGFPSRRQGNPGAALLVEKFLVFPCL